jgi:hypothetical protein
LTVLLEECTPRAIQKRLPARAIRTVQEMGWAGIRNGELLTLAERQFDVFVTTDKNLRYQQNLAGRRLAVMLLSSNQVPVVIQLLTAIDAAPNSIQPGDDVEIPLPLLP